MPLDTNAPFLLDGQLLANGDGDPVGLLNQVGMQVDWAPSKSMRRSAANTLAVSLQLGMVGGLHGPTGAKMPTWTATIPVSDAYLTREVQRIVERPSAHMLAVKADFVVQFDGGSNPIQSAITECYLDRYLYADGHTQDATGAASNIGSAVSSATFRLRDGTVLTKTYKRGVSIDDWTLMGGTVITVTLIDGFGVSTVVTITEGVDYVAAVSNANTAALIQPFIDAMTGITATVVGDEVRVVKTAKSAVALEFTVGAGASVMPTTGEVAIDIDVTTPYAWRNFVTGGALADRPGELAVTGWFAFPVTCELGTFAYSVRGDLRMAYRLTITHTGLGL